MADGWSCLQAEFSEVHYNILFFCLPIEMIIQTAEQTRGLTKFFPTSLCLPSVKPSEFFQSLSFLFAV